MKFLFIIRGKCMLASRHRWVICRIRISWKCIDIDQIGPFLEATHLDRPRRFFFFVIATILSFQRWWWWWFSDCCFYLFPWHLWFPGFYQTRAWFRRGECRCQQWQSSWLAQLHDPQLLTCLLASRHRWVICCRRISWKCIDIDQGGPLLEAAHHGRLWPFFFFIVTVIQISFQRWWWGWFLNCCFYLFPRHLWFPGFC